jgi:predicted dehydrogenase
MPEPVRVGIAGAGPWAKMFYGPILAAGPETALAGVWARRPEAAAEVAGAHGAPVFDTFEEMLGAVDAVAISVAPEAQPRLAVAAGEAGRALIIEKPLAASLDEAEALADALRGAPAMLMLTNRYNTLVRERLRSARAFAAYGARGQFLSGAFLPGSPFASGWRLERGALLDVGPHIIDIAWEALGPVTEVSAAGSLQSLVALHLTHEGGPISQILISAKVGVERQLTGLELFGPGGQLVVDPGEGRETVAPTIRRELAEMVRTRQPHPVGVERGLVLQRIVDEAERQLGGRR